MNKVVAQGFDDMVTPELGRHKTDGKPKLQKLQTQKNSYEYQKFHKNNEKGEIIKEEFDELSDDSLSNKDLQSDKGTVLGNLNYVNELNRVDLYINPGHNINDSEEKSDILDKGTFRAEG